MPEYQQLPARRRFKLAILRICERKKPNVHRRSLTGLDCTKSFDGRPSALETELGVDVSDAVKAEAHRAFDELLNDGLIEPTFIDISGSRDWVRLTSAGGAALARDLRDDLDEALLRVSSNLVELRDGAWAALNAKTPDALRQAAHSARELVDQVLHTVAPDAEIKAQAWFMPEPSSNSGVTRKHRIRFAIVSRRGSRDRVEEQIVELQASLVAALTDKLIAASHKHSVVVDRLEVEDALRTVESGLRRLLIG